MAKTRVAEMVIKADIKEEALNSREEALRENPFAGLFPSLKEAAAHKTLEKSLKRDMLKNSTMNQMLDEVVEKEQCEVPLIINEQDLVGVSLSKQGPEVSNMKVETVVAAEEIGKPDISFPHEPGAGGADCKQSKNEKTMEKATLLKLMSSEIRLKYAIKALDSLCNTEAETLSWDKLERISERLEEHWYSYENAFTAYQELFNQYSAAGDKHFFTMLEAFMAVERRARTLLEISSSGGNAKYELLLQSRLEECRTMIKKVQLDKVEMYVYRKVPLIIDKQDQEGASSSKRGPEVSSTKVEAVERRLPGLEKIELKYVHSAKAEAKMDQMQNAQGDESKLKAGEVKNIAKQKLTTQDQLWQPWMSEVQEKAKLSPEAKEVRAAMRAKLNLVIKVETEAEIIMKALAKEECLVRKLASSVCCDEVEKVESNSMIDKLAENSASNQLEEEEKMSKEETDLEADKLVAPVWIESRPMENFAEAAEQLDFKELMLRQHNLNTKEVEKHVDSKQPNYIVKVETEAKENRMHLKEAKQSLKVEKDWQGSALLVFDKQDLVGVSLTKKVEMKLMHVLKAEAVWVRNMKQKLMEEVLLEFCKQYLEVEVFEKEGREALQLLVDKQAAAAG